MALPRPTLEAALLHIVRNPAIVVPGTHVDAARREAAADLASMEYSASVASVPQSASYDMQVTIGRVGGTTPVNADSFARLRWPVIELATWVKMGVNRGRRQDVLDFGHCLDLLLNGLTGTFKGVEIAMITPEVDPFQQDEAPGDGSDRWLPNYTFTYVVQYRHESVALFPSHRVAQGVEA